MNKWNNPISRVSIAVFMAATSLSAIPMDPCDCPPPPVCCEQPRPGPFAFAYPYDVNLNCPRDFYFHADLLVMQAKQDGLEWAIKDSNGTGLFNASITNGKFEGFSSKNDDWGYDLGARVGMGFYMNHDAWNLDFDWTWLNMKEYRNANAGTAGGDLIPLWLLGISNPREAYGPRSSAKRDGSYNTIDARLGKAYHVSRYLVFNPHFGLRGAWIKQHFSVDYSGIQEEGGATPNRVISHNDNDFWGVGARAGIDTDWFFGKGFSLYGNLATSILFGYFDIEQHLTFPDDTPPGYDIVSAHYMNVPNLEIALGVSWSDFFDCQRYRFMFKAGYEFHVWWDQLNLRRFWSGASGDGIPFFANDVVSRGTLSLNGFVFRAQIDL